MRCDETFASHTTIFMVGACDSSHFGKFDSCADDAIYGASLEADDWTGSCDFEGTFALVTFSQGECLQITSGAVVVILPGTYLVHTAPSGGVTVYSDRDEDVRAIYRRAEIATEGWDGPEFCDECPGFGSGGQYERCADHAAMLADPAGYLQRMESVPA